MPQELYAYTLRNQEPGWAWHIYDVDGDVVASGLEQSQTAAAQAVQKVIGLPEKPVRSFAAA
jgi:hypothetical protein